MTGSIENTGTSPLCHILLFCHRQDAESETRPSAPLRLLDIHTVESLIELTTANADVSLREAGLSASITDDLDIYFVSRFGDPSSDLAY